MPLILPRRKLLHLIQALLLLAAAFSAAKVFGIDELILGGGNRNTAQHKDGGGEISPKDVVIEEHWSWLPLEDNDNSDKTSEWV